MFEGGYEALMSSELMCVMQFSADGMCSCADTLPSTFEFIGDWALDGNSWLQDIYVFAIIVASRLYRAARRSA